MDNPGIDDDEIRELFDGPQPDEDCGLSYDSEAERVYADLERLERRQRGAEACVILLAILIVFDWIRRANNDPAE